MGYTTSDLEMAEHHIIEGERHLAKQRLLVAKLAERAAPAPLQQQARELLAQFELTLQAHRTHRDEIREALHRQAVADARDL